NFVVYPGPGFLITQAGYGSTPYRPARVRPADKKIADATIAFADLSEGYRVFDAENGEQTLSFEVELDPGRTVKGTLIGPDSQPVVGAVAYGLNYYDSRHPGSEEELKTDAFTAVGLDLEEARTLTLVHKERKLIRHVIVDGKGQAPRTVRLIPWGTLTGRLVD